MEPKSYQDLQELSVEELRRYARALAGFPIRGREISRATRSELLQLIKTTDEQTRTNAATHHPDKSEDLLRGDIT